MTVTTMSTFRVIQNSIELYSYSVLRIRNRWIITVRVIMTEPIVRPNRFLCGSQVPLCQQTQYMICVLIKQNGDAIINVNVKVCSFVHNPLHECECLSMHGCTCRYEYMEGCLNVCRCVCVYVHVCVYGWMNVLMYACVYVCMCMYVCMYVSMHACMYE